MDVMLSSIPYSVLALFCQKERKNKYLRAFSLAPPCYLNTCLCSKADRLQVTSLTPMFQLSPNSGAIYRIPAQVSYLNFMLKRVIAGTAALLTIWHPRPVTATMRRYV